MTTPEIGTLGWTDLTVDDAEAICDFYAQVVGWARDAVDMGGYSDFTMNAADGTSVAGICHARGGNADMPAQWLPYIVVESLDESVRRCKALGGDVIAGPKGKVGSPRYCVIRDPAGAVAALYQPA